MSGLWTGVALVLAIAGVARAQAPLPAGDEITWVHAPYEIGACDVCHASADPDKPGRVRKQVSARCLGCHEEIRLSLSAAVHVHNPAADRCTACHNPHNSSRRMLLVKDLPSLCTGCHDALGQHPDAAAQAQPTGAACLGCHEHHASAAEDLLKAPAGQPPTPSPG